MLDYFQQKDVDRKPYHCVFEYCEKTLSRHFRDRLKSRAGLFPPEETKKMMSQMLEALNYMHGNMILHRDIKPDNILLDHQGINTLLSFS
jgi:serine/threonine protein kinase